MATVEVSKPHLAPVIEIPKHPETEPFEKQTDALAMRAKDFTISTNDQFVDAGEILKEIARKRSEIEEAFEPSVKAAYQAHRSLTALVKKLTDPLVQADALFRSKMLTYDRQLKAEREEQERIEREAREAMAREDKEREANELVSQAAELEKAGDKLGAAAVMAEAENVAAAPVITEPVMMSYNMPQVAGVSTRENWTIDEDHIDIKALCKAVLEDKVPVTAISPNLVYLRQRAKSDKGMFQIPGVRAYDKGGLSVRK